TVYNLKLGWRRTETHGKRVDLGVIGWWGQNVDLARGGAGARVDRIHASAEIDRESRHAVTTGLDALVPRAPRDRAGRGIHFENALGGRGDQQSAAGRVECRWPGRLR